MRRRSKVSTWTKSAARMPRACAVRNCFQVGPVRRGAGSIPASCRICHTVEAAMGWPSLTSSPCTRRCPHVGLSVAMQITSLRMAAAVGGRPGLRQLVYSHLRAASRRCQARSVAGVTANTSPHRRRCWARIHDRGSDLLSCCRRVGLSGGDLVLVRETAEDLFPADPVLGEVDLRWPGASLSRCELAKGSVRPGCVVVQQVFGQYSAQVMLADDQQPVKEFPAQGTYDPFADRVALGA